MSCRITDCPEGCASTTQERKLTIANLGKFFLLEPAEHPPRTYLQPRIYRCCTKQYNKRLRHTSKGNSSRSSSRCGSTKILKKVQVAFNCRSRLQLRELMYLRLTNPNNCMCTMHWFWGCIFAFLCFFKKGYHVLSRILRPYWYCQDNIPDHWLPRCTWRVRAAGARATV